MAWLAGLPWPVQVIVLLAFLLATFKLGLLALRIVWGLLVLVLGGLLIGLAAIAAGSR